MGTLLNLTKEYFGNTERSEDRISLDFDGGDKVKERSFADKNGKFHEKGYYIDEKDSQTANDILAKLINKAVEKRGCECDLNDIDVSNIKSLSSIFTYVPAVDCVIINPDVSGWDTSNVENFKSCFYCLRKFDGDLSKWNVSKGTDFESMFLGCSEFKGKGLENWKINTDEHTFVKMKSMFAHCDDFNGDIRNWNVSRVVEMSHMFLNCKIFDRNLCKWDVSNVTNMKSMFQNCSLFKHNLSGWNVENVTNYIDFCIDSGIKKVSFFPKFKYL